MEPYNNEYLKKFELNNLDLWDLDLYELQQSIEDNALVIIDFQGDASIIMTKDEIYVEDWNQGDFPSIDCFPFWKDDEKYQIRDYIILENDNISYSDYYIGMAKMMKRLFEKCQYTLTYNTKESILEEINSRYL